MSLLGRLLLKDTLSRDLVFYDIDNLTPITIKEASSLHRSHIARSVNVSDASKETISHSKQKSIKVDISGKQLTEDQQKYFANEDSLLLDENGALKRYFHGIARMDRIGTVFRPDRATSGPMA